jgi:formylglycine-generating enzyme required for sulfatase activity
MPTKLLFISLIAIGLFSFSKKNKETTIAIESKTWAKSWGKVQEGMWMQKTEVSNAEFRLFLNDLKDKGRLDEFKEYYPDTTGWAKGGNSTQPYKEFYFSHPSFNNYPVVNVTYEAAKAYCIWLSEHYAGSKKQPFGKVEFRLPTQEEWIKAASSGKEDGRRYPWNGMYLRNNRGEYLCNFHRIGDESITSMAGNQPFTIVNNGSSNVAGSLNEKVFITAPVNSFFPNDIGLYNVCGNVAEMLAEKGVAAGGSYDDTGYDIRIQSTKPYSGAARDVGFRVLMQTTAP